MKKKGIVTVGAGSSGRITEIAAEIANSNIGVLGTFGAPKTVSAELADIVDEPIKITRLPHHFFDRPKMSKNQLRKCAKGLHIFKEIPGKQIGPQEISTTIYRCGCGVLEHTREMDPNLKDK